MRWKQDRTVGRKPVSLLAESSRAIQVFPFSEPYALYLSGRDDDTSLINWADEIR